MVDQTPLWDLRALKRVVIPAGVERIGSYWFSCSYIEYVEIPASVFEIGVEAFSGCQALRSVCVAKGSLLERVEALAFWGAGVARSQVDFPDDTLVHEYAFSSV